MNRVVKGQFYERACTERVVTQDFTDLAVYSRTSASTLNNLDQQLLKHIIKKVIEYYQTRYQVAS